MTQKTSQKKSEVDSFTPLRGVCPQNCYIISGTRQRANFMTPHPTPPKALFVYPCHLANIHNAPMQLFDYLDANWFNTKET